MVTHLHLGCGDVRLPPPWTNVDRRWGPAVDRCDNIGILQHIEPGSVSEIYACHCLDHFDRWTYKTVLARWFALLKPGGVLRISTPDFEATVKQYQRTGDLAALTGQLYASQDYPDNVRHFCWNYSMACDDLMAIGFEVPERYDGLAFCQSLDVSLRDASCLHWRGVPRSLNITARKPE